MVGEVNAVMCVVRLPKLPCTQTSLFDVLEGDNGLRLPSVPFPWSLAVHHQSLAFRARLCHAKNEGPEEEAVDCLPQYDGSGIFQDTSDWYSGSVLFPEIRLV